MANHLASGPAPQYLKVKTHLREGIASGRWRPGERLPSESELTDAFGVSRMTVNRALRELQAEIDPSAELWNRHAPFEYLVTRRVKVVCDLPDGGRETKWLSTSMGNCALSQHFMERHGFGTKVEIIDQPATLPFQVRGVVA